MLLSVARVGGLYDYRAGEDLGRKRTLVSVLLHVETTHPDAVSGWVVEVVQARMPAAVAHTAAGSVSTTAVESMSDWVTRSCSCVRSKGPSPRGSR